jgi:type-F conjugative transfer system pilin assembly protein TrbC
LVPKWILLHLWVTIRKKGSTQQLAESGKLQRNPGLIQAIESLVTQHGNYSEILICDADVNYSIGRLKLDPFSNLLYSTQPEDYTRIKELTDQGVSVSDAIQYLLQGKCVKTTPSQDQQFNLYVFVSFSMTDESWLSISKAVEQLGGSLVLRGLPNNSFQELAKKIHDLRKRGVNAHIQIDPRLFTKYAIEKVPCFVVLEESSFEKLYGNVSLPFALEKMSGKTTQELRRGL